MAPITLPEQTKNAIACRARGGVCEKELMGLLGGDVKREEVGVKFFFFFFFFFNKKIEILLGVFRVNSKMLTAELMKDEKFVRE